QKAPAEAVEPLLRGLFLSIPVDSVAAVLDPGGIHHCGAKGFLPLRCSFWRFSGAVSVAAPRKTKKSEDKNRAAAALTIKTAFTFTRLPSHSPDWQRAFLAGSITHDRRGNYGAQLVCDVDLPRRNQHRKYAGALASGRLHRRSLQPLRRPS